MAKLRRSDDQKVADRIRENMILLQGGRNSAEMAGIIGAKSKETWRKRLLSPESLTLKEARFLTQKCGVDLAAFVAGRLSIT